MGSVSDRTSSIWICVVTMALSLAFGPINAPSARLSAQAREPAGEMNPARRMADGKLWTTQNLNLNATPSYCYEDTEINCRRYGRLYTWESAGSACRSLGDGWRLPADGEWREMAKRYGGVSEDSEDKGKAAYKALLDGGSSGFNALLGGGRSDAGEYARVEAHGFYWSASENDPASAVFYNFGRGGLAFHRQNSIEKGWALSVRCVKH